MTARDSIDIQAEAARIGIKVDSLRARIRKWGIDRALEEPAMMDRSKRGRLGKANSPWRHLSITPGKAT